MHEPTEAMVNHGFNTGKDFEFDVKAHCRLMIDAALAPPAANLKEKRCGRDIGDALRRVPR
ncbi:hypothetical protein ABIC16_004171 [Sphingomonas sp. PvP055]|jgi:hypothetical protein|uniref:hypothetical protein n=1 Tax=Sphingomonas sp. PvP055 TaxID=3156391 RepID=UPI0033964BC5